MQIIKLGEIQSLVSFLNKKILMLSSYGIVIVCATLIYYLPLGTVGLPYVFWYIPSESVFVDTILPTYVPAAVEEFIPLEPPIIEKPKPKLKGIWAVLAFLKIIFRTPVDWFGAQMRIMVLSALQLVTVGFFAAAMLSIVSRVNQTPWRKGWSGIRLSDVEGLRILIPGTMVKRRVPFDWLLDERLNWLAAPARLGRYKAPPLLGSIIVSAFRNMAMGGAFCISLGAACFSVLTHLISIAFSSVINGHTTVSYLLFKGGLYQRFLIIKDAHWRNGPLVYYPNDKRTFRAS